MTPALGSIDKRGNKTNPIRYVATFDEETFAEVRAYAVRSKLSLAAAIRELVEWGLAEEGSHTASPAQGKAVFASAKEPTEPHSPSPSVFP